jgi:hypothetical protein
MSYIRSAIFISKKKKKKGKVQGYNTSEGRIFDGYCEGTGKLIHSKSPNS